MHTLKTAHALIGNTPLLFWGGAGEAKIWFKDEGRNLSGSLKDRHVKAILDGMAARGELAKGKRLLDATSGSFGTALTLQGILRGMKTTIVVNENISKTNVTFLEGLGAEVIRHGKVTGDGYRYCLELVKNAPEKYAFTDQLNNPDVAKAHEETASEILRDMPDVSAIIASMGSGATLLGIARRIAELGREIPLFAVVGIDGDEGKLAGTFVESLDYLTPFIKEIDEQKLVTRVSVRYREGMDAVWQQLAPRGILAGPQAGGVLIAALQAVETYQLQGNVVAIAGDSLFKNLDRFARG